MLAGFAGRWAWPLDLFAHFPVQYVAVLACCAAWLFVMRRRWLAAFALAGAVLGSVGIIAYAGWPTRASYAAVGNSFRLVTFNRFKHNGSLQDIAAYFETSGADVIAVEELEGPAVARLASRLPSFPYVFTPAAKPCDVVIFSRWPILSSDGIRLAPGGVSVASVRVDWKGHAVNVVGAHLHWPLGAENSRLRNAELQGLARLARATQGPLAIGGDLNVTPWSRHFRTLLQDGGLEDCARGRGLVATWPSWFVPVRIRIDHCLTNAQLGAVSVQTGPSLGSDHLVAINDLEVK